jgi:hypothetical protein
MCSTTAVVGDRTEYNETEADFEIFGTLRNVYSSSLLPSSFVIGRQGGVLRIYQLSN